MLSPAFDLFYEVLPEFPLSTESTVKFEAVRNRSNILQFLTLISRTSNFTKNGNSVFLES